MNWGIEDLTPALLLILLAAAGLWCVFSLIRVGPLRTLLGVAIIVTVATVWAHHAVGLFEWGKCERQPQPHLLALPHLIMNALKLRPYARLRVHLLATLVT